ncbi:glycosyltransferase [Enteroscipio rubneri]|uniref:Glycosyl transferase n=1 Tax=Enteroscipio rubneri TaxID=2070686 RepID=A0A2K2UA55_9ACTN|nr:glycosyltransferase [Enteroscipio rubneri]PNV67201.1 glycosyl transferase [Enteroscipio rubneri]
MKLAQINAYSAGSTGKLMQKEHMDALSRGDDSYVFWARGDEPHYANAIRVGTIFDVYVHAACAHVTGRVGFCGSKRATEKMVQQLRHIEPDSIHLHNLHGYSFHLPTLFGYLEETSARIEWTLHDCWSFTGHCGHFTAVGCSQWKKHCGRSMRCPMQKVVPWSLFDSSERNFADKKQLFSSLQDVNLIVPSQWLADLVSQSYLAKYPISVVPNKVDENVFKPTCNNFKKNHGIEDKIMVLGVASPWNEQKGLSLFLNLAQLLDDRFALVLVGLDGKQRAAIKKMAVTDATLIPLPVIADGIKLAKIYTAADFFWNASIEETFGMTTLEAISCGAFAIVCTRTPGEEIISAETGIALPADAELVASYLTDRCMNGGKSS